MKKKILSLIMCSIFIINLFSFHIYAEVCQSDWTYNVLSEVDKTAEITGYIGTETELVFPEEIDGYTMIAIADNAFDYNADEYFEKPIITKVTIPETYKRIGDNFLDYTFELEEINLPHSLEFIGLNSFKHSKYIRLQLHEAAMEKKPSVAYIGEYCIHAEQNKLFPESYTVKPGTKLIASGAFYRVKTLKKLFIPEGVEYINDGAFVWCSISSVVIPDTVKSIDWLAFGYSSLTAIVIPESVERIDNEAFANRTQYLTVYGVSGSYAEQFAKDHSLSFVDLKDVVYGDVDQDGVVTVNDYASMKSNVLFEIEYEGDLEIIGDMNGDCVIDGFDLFHVDMAINGLA